MAHKAHLEHTNGGGPVCQRGRVGGQLRGEHLTFSFDEFRRTHGSDRCARCESSKLFSFLMRKASPYVRADDDEIEEAASKWEPVDDPDAWKRADDARIAARLSA